MFKNKLETTLKLTVKVENIRKNYLHVDNPIYLRIQWYIPRKLVRLRAWDIQHDSQTVFRVSIPVSSPLSNFSRSNFAAGERREAKYWVTWLVTLQNVLPTIPLFKIPDF